MTPVTKTIIRVIHRPHHETIVGNAYTEHQIPRKKSSYFETVYIHLYYKRQLNDY